MTLNVNHIRNPDFSLGKDSVRNWEVDLDRKKCEFHRGRSECGQNAVFLTPRAVGRAFVWQTVRCKPDSYYRVELVARCNLVTAGDSPGLRLVLRPDDSAGGKGEWVSSVPVLSAPDPVDIRAYFHAPDWCDEVRIGVGLGDVVGWAELLEVRFIRILEPDESSHPLAIQPPYALPARSPVETACIVVEDGAGRPLSSFLQFALGEDHVSQLQPVDFSMNIRADVVLLPDLLPPRAVKSMRSLLALAETKLVIISLPAFSALAGKSLRLRRIEQPDDPIHAKVVFSNDATRGFALHDCFAYAWPGKHRGGFAQNQFRKTPEFREFCKKYGFEVLLESNCDKDHTSDQPICLFRKFDRGALYVLDLNPLEAPSSTLGEPTLAAHLLLSVLGRSPAPAGQFSVPLRKESAFREMIREAANRWDHFCVHDEDVPTGEVMQQIVTIGREDEMYGLPAAEKPVILVRSGLTGGDAPGVCGTWAWFRQLLLHSGHPSSYAAALAARFRLAWVPCVAPWEARDGWAASSSAPLVSTELEFDGGRVAALIDVTEWEGKGIRVSYSRATPAYRRAAEWLPRLTRELSAAEFSSVTTGRGPAPGERLPYSWDAFRPEVNVSVAPDLFDEEVCNELFQQGGDAIRIELPSFESDYVANSILHTHLTVTTLERVVGLLYGLIAVNRGCRAVSLPGVGTIAPGEARVLPSCPAGAELEGVVGAAGGR